MGQSLTGFKLSCDGEMPIKGKKCQLREMRGCYGSWDVLLTDDKEGLGRSERQPTSVLGCLFV